MLAHVASYQGDIAVLHALDSIGGFDGFEEVIVEKADFSTIPATTFTHPNIGSVGLHQREAKEKYGEILVGRFSYARRPAQQNGPSSNQSAPQYPRQFDPDRTL